MFCSETVTRDGFVYNDVSDTPLDHTQAEQHCVEWGGHLASVASEQENEFLTDFASKSRNCNDLDKFVPKLICFCIVTYLTGYTCVYYVNSVCYAIIQIP